MRLTRAKLLDKQGDRRDFIGLVRHLPLPQHQAVGARVGRNQMQCRLAAPAVMAAPRGLAVDGDLAHCGRQALGHEVQKARSEQLRPDPVHHHPEPIGAGNAIVVLLQAAQEIEVLLPPQHDVVIVVAGRHGRANHQKQHFAQGIHHLARLAIILYRRKMLQKTFGARCDDFIHGFPQIVASPINHAQPPLVIKSCPPLT